MTARHAGRGRRPRVSMAGPPRRRRSSWLPLAGAGALVLAGAFAVVRATSTPLTPDASGTPVTRGDVAAVTRAPAPPPEPGHEVYGYVPYWEMDGDIVEHVASTELTTLALFAVTQRPDGSLVPNDNGRRALDGDVGVRLLADAHARGLRVELVWASFGEEKNRPLFEDRTAQDRLAAELTALVIDRGFDGLNVDVEGLPMELVPAYGAFLGRLRETLRAADPDAQVSAATGASHLGAAMAAAAAANGADRVFLMGYDYRTSRSAPGATAPLDRTDGGEKDLQWSLELYRQLGVPVERTILGLPLYGMTWPVIGEGFGAAAVGPGEAWIPRRHVAALAGGALETVVDETESVEFFALARDDRWDAVYFDSPRSLAPKLALANARGLAGVGFWAIGYERGLPDYTAMIATFAAGE